MYEIEILTLSLILWDHKALNTKVYLAESSQKLLVYNWIIVKMCWNSISEVSLALNN